MPSKKKEETNALALIGQSLPKNMEGKLDLRLTKSDLVTVYVHEMEKKLKLQIDATRKEINAVSRQISAEESKTKALARAQVESAYRSKAEEIKTALSAVLKRGPSLRADINWESSDFGKEDAKIHARLQIYPVEANDHRNCHLEVSLKDLKPSKKVLDSYHLQRSLKAKHSVLLKKEDTLCLQYNDVPRIEREANAALTVDLMKKAGLTFKPEEGLTDTEQ